MTLSLETPFTDDSPQPASDVAYFTGGGRLFARFADGSLVPVERTRARGYPGLAAEAPPTGPLYEAAAHELSGAKSVVDLGCGAGVGTRVLVETFDEVVGVDSNPAALDFAKQFAAGARFASADAFERGQVAPVDGAVIVDMLGHVESPFAVLRQLRSRLTPGSCVVIAEPAAFPAQCLRSPARRAFSVRSLASLLAASSFAIRDWICDDGTFLACVALAVEDGGADALATGVAARGRGDLDAAVRAYQIASVGTRPEVHLEAQLSLADVHLARRDGDAACRAYFRARDVDSADARPLAGLAQVSLAIGHADDSRVLCTKAVQLDPSEMMAAGVLALTLDVCAPADAPEAWGIAHSLAPDNLMFATRLANSFLRKNEPTAALHVLERLRAYGDDCGAALHVAMASALRAAGRILDARLEAKMALARAPQEPEVRRLWEELQP